eukprot:403354725
MIKTSAFLVSLMVSSTIAASPDMKLYPHFDSNMHQIQDDVWPPVNVAYNFEVDFSFQIWDPTMQKLIPFANMNGTQYVDSNGNREKVIVYLQMDKLGMLPIKQVFDYNTRTMIEHVPTFPKCNKYTIPDEINVGETLKRVFSPKGGVTNFVGEEQLKWENGPDYEFKVGKANPETTPQTPQNRKHFTFNHEQL